MKPTRPLIDLLILGTLAVLCALAFAGCAELAGTTFSFGEDGSLTIDPPDREVVIQPSK